MDPIKKMKKRIDLHHNAPNRYIPCSRDCGKLTYPEKTQYKQIRGKKHEEN